MRLFDKVKHSVFATITVLAVSAMATTGLDASAKTVTEPKQTTKQVTTVGSGASYYDEDGDWSEDTPLTKVTNLKINGKKYTKGSIKKKVATTQYSTDTRAYKSWSGAYTEYKDSDTIYDEETDKKERLNYKWISTSNYQLRFLKAGTYKVSYDTYSYLPSNSANYKLGGYYYNEKDNCDYYRIYEDGQTRYAQCTPSDDKKTLEVRPVLFKTQHVDTYKVVQTTRGLKSITLGKSKQTWTVSSNGTKTTTKNTYKNRYLKGKSGKVKYTMNKGYSFQGAFAVTRGADGYITISKANNKAKIPFSQGKYYYTDSYTEYVIDANGDKVIKKDPATGKPVEKVEATYKGKYKETEIYYGWKDKFTGDYTKYDVTTRQVYAHVKDENDEYVYQKNADGSDAKDADGNRIPSIEEVTATVITKQEPRQQWVQGTYTTVNYKYEMVVLPKDLPTDRHFYLDGYYGNLYYTDATAKEQYRSGSWDWISVNVVGSSVVYTADQLDSESDSYSPSAARALYNTSYKGTWVVYDKATMDSALYAHENDEYYADCVVNADGSKTYTYYGYQYAVLDEDGDPVANTLTNKVIFNHSTTSSVTFQAK